jgi:hypothetical protein
MPKVAQKKAAPAITDLVVHDCQQGSIEWLECRLGRATASNFATIMASGKDGGISAGRATLLRKLAGELLTGEPMENFTTKEMEKGTQMEPEILDWYQRTKFADVEKVGFIYNPELDAGWSPDGLVGADGAIEMKWHRPDVMIELLDRGTFPSAHRPQVHGAMWVGRRKWIDYVAFSHSKLPKYVARVEVDMIYRKEISDAVQIFNWDLKKMVERMRAKGATG